MHRDFHAMEPRQRFHSSENGSRGHRAGQLEMGGKPVRKKKINGSAVFCQIQNTTYYLTTKVNQINVVVTKSFPSAFQLATEYSHNEKLQR